MCKENTWAKTWGEASPYSVLDRWETGSDCESTSDITDVNFDYDTTKVIAASQIDRFPDEAPPLGKLQSCQTPTPAIKHTGSCRHGQP